MQENVTDSITKAVQISAFDSEEGGTEGTQLETSFGIAGARSAEVTCNSLWGEEKGPRVTALSIAEAGDALARSLLGTPGTRRIAIRSRKTKAF